MRIKLPNDLITIATISILLVIIITLFPSNILRAILGVPFVIFLPGYTLIAAIRPSPGDVNNLEKIGLSFALSIPVSALTGTILNYTSAGIRIYTVFPALLIFVIINIAIAWYRRRKAEQETKPLLSLDIKTPSTIISSLKGQSLAYKILSVALAIAVLGAVGVAIYMLAIPATTENFTEFYLLGTGTNTEDYPKEMRVGQEGKVILKIINREQKTVSYWIETHIENTSKGKTNPLALKNNETGEETVTFSLDKAGNNQKVEFWLYKNRETQPYLSLRIWVNVTN